MTAPDREPDEFLCPGETHPISRSVHLARLAAFYPGCRECPRRNETGQLPQQLVGRFAETEQRAPRPSWLSGEGVRAVYLNELNRAPDCGMDRRPGTPALGRRPSPGSNRVSTA